MAMDLIARLKTKRKCSNVFKVQRENYFEHRILDKQLTKILDRKKVFGD